MVDRAMDELKERVDSPVDKDAGKVKEIISRNAGRRR